MTGFRNMLQGAAGAAGGGYSVDNSILLDDGSSQYLTWTPAGAGSSDKIGTISVWVKRGNITEGNIFSSGASGSDYNTLTFKSDHKLQFSEDTNNFTFTTTQVFRDPHSWYHIVVAFDTTQSTSSNRVKFYVNGGQITSFDTETYPAQNFSMNYGAAKEHNLGRLAGVGGSLLDGYIAEAVYIDGSQLDPTSFGEYDTNGVWRPVDVSGLTFGTNGFYLPFTDSNALGLDTQASATAAQAYTEFQCNFDGSDGATSATDASKNSATITFSGNAQLDTAQQKFGTASLLLDGTGDYVSIPDASYLEIGSKDFTIDCWIRFSTVPTNQETIVSKWTGTGNQRSFNFAFEGSTSNLIIQLSGDGSSTALNKQESWSPSQDTWYHVAVERTGGNVHLYVNGTQLGSGTANSTNIYNGSATFMVGALNAGAAQNFTGHVDEVRFINGYGAYQGSNFTAPTTAYVTPPTSNSFTPSGSPTQSSDTPTDNHLAFSSIYNDTASSSSHITYSKGNKKAFCTLGRSAVGNMVIPKGTSMKLYLEVTPNTLWDSTGRLRVGISSMTNSDNPIDTDTLSAFFQDDGDLFDEGTETTSWGSSWQTLNTDYAMIAVETDGTNVDVWFGVNGSWQASGDPANGTSPAATFTQDNDMRFVAKLDTNGSSTSCTIATETSEFQTAAPTGFGPWSTSEMYSQVAPAIEDGTAYFDIHTRTGTGAEEAVTAFSFAPSLSYIKKRNGLSNWLFNDLVRGAQLELYGNLNNAEAPQTQGIKTFDANGYTLGTAGDYNNLNDTFVDYAWKGDGTSGASNTNGTITSTVNVNDTAGFSFGTYSGTGSNATVGHGLSAAPEFLLVKSTNNAYSWAVYHSGLTSAGYKLILDQTNAQVPDSTTWNSTAPSSTVFSVGTDNGTNNGSAAYVFYAWRSTPSYSAFGSYKGNSLSDGSLVLLDFAPAFVIAKCIDTAGTQWVVHDNKRPLYNDGSSARYRLYADADSTENATANWVDFGSNFFKWRLSSQDSNNSSNGTYIYAAFAENPFAGSSPATAR